MEDQKHDIPIVVDMPPGTLEELEYAAKQINTTREDLARRIIVIWFGITSEMGATRES